MSEEQTTRRRRKAEEKTEEELQLEAINDRMGPPAEGMKRAIVTVAGLSIPSHGTTTRVVRKGGVFDAPAEFVDRMAKLERCERV